MEVYPPFVYISHHKIAASYDSCSNCGGECSSVCNYNTCKSTNMSGCSYDSSCTSVCILSACGAGCSRNNGLGCGSYNSCSVGCQVECATNSCIIVCRGLATV